MKTILTEIAGTRSLATFPLTILAWLEAAGLKMELAAYLRRAKGSDRWFMALEDECVGPVPFAVITQRLLAGTGPLPILYASDSEQQPPPWRVVAYRSWALKGWQAAIYCTGFWLLAICFGWVLLSLALPLSARHAAGWVYFAACTTTAAGHGYMELRRWRRPQRSGVTGERLW